MMTVYPRRYGKEVPSIIPSIVDFDARIDDIDFDDPFIEALVLDIDRTQHIKGRYFESPVLGPISPRELSGGVKSLLSIYYADDYYSHYSDMFGNNCVDWLRQLSFKKDFGLVYDSSLWFHIGNKTIPDLPTRPVMAQTVDGRSLKTCRDVWNYAIDN